MGFRLYDSAWVMVDGTDAPLQVTKNRKNAAIFNVGDFEYDIDARPLPSQTNAPAITGMHSLQSAREAGLDTTYNKDTLPQI